MSIFKSEKKKVNDYFKNIDMLFLATFGNTKDLFPEESLWLFNTHLKKGFRYYSKIAALYLTLIDAEIPQRIRDKIAKRFDEENPEYSYYFKYIHTLLSNVSKDEFDENHNENFKKTCNYIGYAICSFVQKEYEEIGESYNFTVKFGESVGNIVGNIVFKQYNLALMT